jgi:hypothetical protein
VDIEPVDIDLEPLSLFLDTRVTRGADDTDSEAASPLERIVSLGRPVVIALTAKRAGADKELAAFIEGERGVARYALVYLACSFNRVEGAGISRAWVNVKLSAPKTGPEEAPIAWSMEPLRSRTALTQNRKVTLKVPMKFVEVGGESSVTSQVEEVFCEALGLQESTASWEFTDRESMHLTGSHRLHLVVRAPSEAVTGAVSIHAEVERRRLGIFSYKTQAGGSGLTSFAV